MIGRYPVVSAWGRSAIFWMVVRGRGEPLTVADVARRLGADPGAAVSRTMLDLWDQHVLLEQSDHGVIVLSANTCPSDEDELWTRLTENAQAWGFWWLVNNTHDLFYAADGALVTSVQQVSSPGGPECFGPDPAALDDHLGALRALGARIRADDEAGVTPEVPYPDWQTALATVEALTGVRLDVDRFT
ncbi:hypothetical protein HTZ77_27020 [Nonomuraea sp. SMC257]|uniref:Uncharacterized protein n=1 Tax=Nonomuraea montanisoli TaxID=2741721 RepID=A0A7Y6IB84_9ACTN|nr:hypothetical protein [Nonomuraea montanisoli]NUW35054.1 hypothetical protein [Nonomuraea montanisoli]